MKSKILCQTHLKGQKREMMFKGKKEREMDFCSFDPVFKDDLGCNFFLSKIRQYRLNFMYFLFFWPILHMHVKNFLRILRIVQILSVSFFLLAYSPYILQIRSNDYSIFSTYAYLVSKYLKNIQKEVRIR